MDLREAASGAERRHPWEVARARFFIRLILDRVSPGASARVLDMGAGDGYFAECLLGHLPAGSIVHCVDPSYPEHWLGDRKLAGSRLMRFCREAPTGEYDWVLLLDVLEHVPQAPQLLRDSVRPRVANDGAVLASVPAWQSLYTAHDTSLGHLRRYAPTDLLAELTNAGLAPRLRGSLFASLLLPRSLGKLREVLSGHHAAPPDGELSTQIATAATSWRWGATPSWLVTQALRADAALCLTAARLSIPLPGLSTWAVAERS